MVVWAQTRPWGGPAAASYTWPDPMTRISSSPSPDIAGSVQDNEDSGAALKLALVVYTSLSTLRVVSSSPFVSADCLA